MPLILLPPSHDSRIPLRLLSLPAHFPLLFSRVPATLPPSTAVRQSTEFITNDMHNYCGKSNIIIMRDNYTKLCLAPSSKPWIPYAKVIRVRFFRSTSFPERQLCSSTSFARVPRNLLIFQSASLQVLPECQFCKSASFAKAQQLAPSTRTRVNLKTRKYFHGYGFRPHVTE